MPQFFFYRDLAQISYAASPAHPAARPAAAPPSPEEPLDVEFVNLKWVQGAAGTPSGGQEEGCMPAQRGQRGHTVRSAHAVPMQYPCSTHAVPMQYPCSTSIKLNCSKVKYSCNQNCWQPWQRRRQAAALGSVPKCALAWASRPA